LTTNAGKDWIKRNLHCCQDCKHTATLEISMKIISTAKCSCTTGVSYATCQHVQGLCILLHKTQLGQPPLSLKQAGHLLLGSKNELEGMGLPILYKRIRH
ncbi:mCG145153, partial [Mus musculus]